MTSGTLSQAHPRPANRLLTPAFVLLALAELCYFTAAGVAIYGLPLYATGPIGSDNMGAGLAFGAFALTALVFRPYAGRLADTWGRRPLMLGGALLAGLGMVLMPYVDTLAMVVVLRLLQGVAEAAFFVAAFASLADLAPPSRMGEAVSYNSLGLYLGIAFGPPLGEVLLERWSFTVTWYGATGLAVLAAVLVLWLGETRPETTSGGGHGRLIHRPAIPVALGFLTSLVAMGAFLAFVSLHSSTVGMGSTSLALIVYGGVVVFGRVAFAKVPDRLPPLLVGGAALATIAAGLLLAATWRTPAGLIAGVVLMAIGVALSTPAFFAAIFATAAPSERGAASGTASAFIDLGLGFGPIGLGLVADSLGIPWAFGMAAGIALAGAIWTISLHGRGSTGGVEGHDQ